MIIEWKDVYGYEGLYQINNLGEVKRLFRLSKRSDGKIYPLKEKTMKLVLTKFGYMRIRLYKNNSYKHFPVHRLVLSSFCGDSKMQCNHINGIKTDNRLENLEWVTASENQIHAIKTGLKINQKGIDHSQNKLTESQVLRIKSIAKNKKELEIGYWSKLAKSLNVSQASISRIIHNKSWTHITV